MSETTRKARKATFEGIRRLQMRWLRVATTRYALRSLFYLLLGGVLVAFLLPETGMVQLALGLAAGALALGIFAALASRPDDALVAKNYDDSVGLKDRVSSSVELAGVEGPMVTALHEEAAAAAERVELGRVYPYSMPREGWLMPLPALLLAAVVFLPGLLSAKPVVDPNLEETLGARTEQLADIISRERAKDPTQRRKELITQLEKLKNELSREKLDKKDAMAELAKMLEQLDEAKKKEEERKLALKKQLKTMTAGDKKQLADQVEKGDYADALNKLEELIDELEKKLEQMKKDGASEEELEQLEKQLQELKELRAKLMKLLMIDVDLQFMGEMIDFLGDFEGDLANIEDMLKGMKFIKQDCDCDKPGL